MPPKTLFNTKTKAPEHRIRNTVEEDYKVLLKQIKEEEQQKLL